MKTQAKKIEFKIERLQTIGAKTYEILGKYINGEKIGEVKRRIVTNQLHH